MKLFLNKLDSLAGIDAGNRIARLLERTVFVCLCLMVLFAPHSIAATQTAWVTGTLAWAARLFIKPRPKFFKTALNLPLLAFFAWSFISSVFSYAPDISLDKMRNVGVLLIFFLFVNNLRNLRAVVFLALALIFSCMINVLWTPIERIAGRGVEIHGLSEISPLKKALLWEGDTLLRANDREIQTPEQLVDELKKSEETKILFYRPDYYFSVDVKRSDLLTGKTALENLGIKSWRKSHNWRSQGFFSHYATYAEVLQLIASLVFGLIIVLFGKRFLPSRAESAETQRAADQKPPQTTNTVLLIVLPICLAGMLFALLLTVTRGPQLGFMISAFGVVLAYGNRKLLLILAAIALPVMIGGIIFLNQTRGVGFFDRTDTSITYRETVYKEGFDLWTQNARHLILGVGMDSIKRYAGQWRLFDDGKLAMGHFHSTPLQLLVERGLPALLLWIWICAVYLRILWKGLAQNPKSQIPNPKLLSGILLGCFGGAIGFLTSSLFHFNLGDEEVAMVFYILMGLGVFGSLAGLASRESGGSSESGV